MSAQTRSSEAASVTHGPHGGPLLAIESGVVEMSVFEAGVPPVFRLYFSDRGRIPRRPPPAASVRVTTKRRGGEEQMFAFRATDSFLESTSYIPAPHEFVAPFGIA